MFTTPRAATTVLHLASLLTQRRWPIGLELDFQNAVAAVLDQANVNYVREYQTGDGPIDFYFPEDHIGLELKVKGSPAAVVRQLQRYAKCDDIAVIVLLTGHASLASFVSGVTDLVGK